MSFSAPRLLRVLVCACVIGGVVELLAAPPLPSLHRSSHLIDSSILERLPIDFIENRGQRQTPARFVARKGTVRLVGRVFERREQDEDLQVYPNRRRLGDRECAVR